MLNYFNYTDKQIYKTISEWGARSGRFPTKSICQLLEFTKSFECVICISFLQKINLQLFNKNVTITM